MRTNFSRMNRTGSATKASFVVVILILAVVLLAGKEKQTNAQPAAVVTPPIGTIMAYSGPIDAAWEDTNGWLLCNGRSLNRTDAKYSELFNRIGSSWGGDGVNQFNIPDLGGRFLRGVDDGTGRDPDAGNRTASKPGGHTGSQVGSVQDDALATHKHEIEGYHLEGSGGSGFDGAGFASNSAQNSGYRRRYETLDYAGRPETRPKNAYVFWIVRYR